MNSMTRCLISFSLAAVLSACIAFPTGFGDPEPFRAKELAFIEVGKTTKTEIAAEIPWPMRSPDGDMWLYAKSREEDEWTVVIVGPGTIDGWTTGTTDYRYVLIRFDENDIVADYETSGSEEVIGCNRSGVCGLGKVFSCRRWGTCALGIYYAATAAEEQDQAAKQFSAPEKGCVAYLYGQPKTMTHIVLDGALVGGLLGDRSFFVEKLDKGARKLKASGPEVRADKKVEFTCRSGSLVFLEIQTTRPGIFFGKFAIVVSQRDTSVGRQAINERELMLLFGS